MIREMFPDNDKLPLREYCRHIIELPLVNHFIIFLVIVNAIVLGLETSSAVMGVAEGILHIVDKLILAVFVVEVGLRLFVHRLQFWKDPWSIFDFLVVAVALVLLIIYYVFAVIATNLFASAYPEWFGSLGRSLYTLFQIMTLESWSMGISRPVMENFPYAWAFFIPFILVATFTMLNLFIAIIVNAMQNYSDKENRLTRDAVHETQSHIESDLHQHLSRLEMEIVEIKSMLVEIHRSKL